eukprot:6687275-Alexandrium_andersonii.AAC.1
MAALPSVRARMPATCICSLWLAMLFLACSPSVQSAGAHRVRGRVLRSGAGPSATRVCVRSGRCDDLNLSLIHI